MPNTVPLVRALVVCLFLLTGLAAVPVAEAGTVSAVAPTGASPGVTVRVTGTGFNATAALNEVSFVQAGQAHTATPTAVQTVDAARGIRRLTLAVPDGLVAGPATIRVRNMATNEVSEGATLAVVLLDAPQPASAAPGMAMLAVRVTASAGTNFDAAAGRTRAAFGAGITVHSTVVESPTALVATVSIAGNAEPGPRDVSVITSTQTLLLRGAFAIASAPPQNLPPVAAIAGPDTATAGVEAAFDASASSDPDGDLPLSFVWDFGDGETATGVSVLHAFSQPGAYTVSVVVTDTRGASASTSRQVVVNEAPPANQPPVPSIAAPGAAVVNTPVSFDGSASADPDGDLPLTFTWNFGDGQTGAGANVMHAYAAAGTFTVTLSVTDARGAVASIEHVVVVSAAPPVNNPPVPLFSGPEQATAGDTVTFDASASSDPDGDLPLTYAWDFGDGSTSAGPLGTHVYTEAGAYTVTLTVTDARGLAAQLSRSVSVEPAGSTNRRPTAKAGGPYGAVAGVPVLVSALASSDPDDDALVYAWDFGDPASNQNAAIGATPQHTYAVAGVYTVTLLVSDGKGGTDTATALVRVAAAETPGNVAPTASAGGPYAARAGVGLVVDASGSTDPDGDTLSYAWSFGDGESGTGVAPSHVYAAPGTYTVTVLVSDGHGGHAEASAQVVVSGAPAPGNRRPTAVAGTDRTAPAGVAVAFDGAGSADPDGDALEFAWSFGDGGAASGASAAHVYERPGVYTARLLVTDGRGGAASDDVVVTVTADAANRAPTAAVSGATGGAAGDTLSFGSTGSFDPDNDPLTFTWAFGDGATSTGPSVTHAFTVAGTYTVELTVADGRGGVATASRRVTISAPEGPANQAPTASAGGPYAAEAGAPVVFSSEGSSDPDGDALTYAWTFGDGASANGPSPSHAFVQAGEYTITLLVSDGNGGVATATAIVTVTGAVAKNLAPVARPGGPYLAVAGGIVSFDGRASSDPDGDTLTYTWLLGEDGAQAAGPTPTHTYTMPGTYTVTLAVSDGRGLSDSATATVTVTAPAPQNSAPTARITGQTNGYAGVALVFDGTTSSDPDGDPLTFEWSFGDQATATGARPSHAYAAAGTFTVTLKVSDPSGASHVTSADVTIVTAPPAGDTLPPVMSLTGAAEALPGTEVAVQAEVTDNVGVAGVRFEVDGIQGDEITAPPYRHVVSIPAVAVPGQQLRVSALARDTSGNTTETERLITVVVSPDTTAPTVTLSAPPQSAPGTLVRVAAQAADATGVERVVFLVNGTEISTSQGAPYEASYAVPSSTQPGGTLAIVARAFDYAGNAGEASATVAIVAEPDTVPPSVTLNAPTEVIAGATIPLTALASDNSGLVGVAFSVDGALLVTDAMVPYEASFVVPAQALPGTIFEVTARATDFAGLEGVSSVNVLVVAAPGEARGVVSGEVYDDRTGVPLANATVTLSGKDGAGRSYGETATTDLRGRFLIRAAAGAPLVRITRDGYTRADRRVTIGAVQAVEMFDARLTPFTVAPQALSPVLGGRLDAGRAVVQVPGGVLPSNAALAVSFVGQQGLQGLLPAGWSPVAAADIAPHGIAFSGPATLTLDNVHGVPNGTPLVVAMWDEAAGVWRATGTVVAGLDGVPFEVAIYATGQYAVLLPDAMPVPPPMPAQGEAVTGIETPTLPGDVTTTILPESRVLFYSPGVRTEVGGRLATAGAVSSGATLWVRLSEQYQLVTGGTLRPEPFVQDFVLFQVGAPVASAPDTPPSPSQPVVGARLFVSPSLAFEAATLREGVISVELLVPPAVVSPGTVLGADGGTVTDAAGRRLVIAPGALADATPVHLEGFDAAALGDALPEGLAFVDGVRVSFEGMLAKPAALSLAAPGGIDPQRLLLVQFREINGRTRPVLAGVVRLVGDRLVTDTSIAGTPTALTGIVSAGRYAILRATSAAAYATGTVLGTEGTPFSGALVEAGSLPVVSLSVEDGRYVAAALAGSTTLRATDLQKADTGETSVTLSSGGLATVNLQLVAAPPRVTGITPANNAADVVVSTAVVVTFSEPIDPATFTVGGQGSFGLTGPSGAVAGTVVFSNGNRTVTFRPAQALERDAVYTVTLTQGIKDVSGYGLQAPFTSQFSTPATRTAPPAGQITASIPATGRTTVRASQGTASPYDTVEVLNLTRGTQTPVAAIEADGSFSVEVDAGLKDKLRLRIVDQSGNELVTDLERFENPDGSVAIGPEGGQLTSGPLTLTVDPGTFPEGAVVKFTALPPSVLTAETGPDYPLVAAFEVSASVDPVRYLKVSAPAPAGATASSTGIVAQITTVFGQQALSIVDTAKVVDGKLTTASPPCEGIVDKFGRYAMFLNEQEQMKLGMALLSMAVPRQRQVIVQPYTLTMPFIPGVPNIVTPPLQFDELYNPASPFIARIQQTGDVIGTIGSATGSTGSQICDPASGICRDTGTAQVCFPVPADQQLRVVVRDARTGEVLQAEPRTAPSSGGVFVVDPSFGANSNDTTAPTTVWTSWSGSAPYYLDPGAPIQVQYSEPVIVKATANPGGPAYLVDQASSALIKLSPKFGENNRLVTFVPERPLAAGVDFVLHTPGLQDLAGNVAAPVTFRTYAPTLVTPTLTAAGRAAVTKTSIASDLALARVSLPSQVSYVGLRDIDFVTRRPEESPDGRWHTTLFGVGAWRESGPQILAFDASSPSAPDAVGVMAGGVRLYTRHRVYRDVRVTFRGAPADDTPAMAAWRARELWYRVDAPAERICAAPGDPAIAAWRARQPAGAPLASATSCGTLGLTTSYNATYSILHFYDLTNPSAPSLLAQRLLSDGGGILGYPRKREAPAANGAARGIAFVPGLDITHTDGSQSAVSENAAAAYVATTGTGLELVDIGRNIPDIYDYDRPPGGPVVESLGLWTFPYYFDVNMVRGRVVAIASDRTDGTGTAHLEVFTPGLQPIGAPLPLPLAPDEMASWEGFLLDTDGDGTAEPHDLTFVTGVVGGLAVVEHSTAGVPQLVGFINTPTAAQMNQGVAVESVTGTCPAIEFSDGSVNYFTTTDTEYRGGTCADVSPGNRVSVAGLPTESGRLRATVVTITRTGSSIFLKTLRSMDLDRVAKRAYISATWTQGGFDFQGLMTVDISAPFGGMRDADRDGRDDRILGFTPIIGPGLAVTAGDVNGLRFDPQRRLIYAALDGSPKDGSEVNLAILRTCECAELSARVRLQSGGVGTGPDVASEDGTSTLIFLTDDLIRSGEFRADFAIDLFELTELTYTVTELPASGLDADRLLDLPGGRQSGRVSSSNPQLRLPLRPLSSLTGGSVVAVEFFDAEGRMVKRALLTLVPTKVQAPDVKVRTYIDRTNQQIYERPGYLVFGMAYDAKVTIRIDGQIVTARADASQPGGTPFENVPLGAGLNRILVTREMVTVPGEHVFEIRAEFDDGVVGVTTGKILHDVSIDEFLPVGHTFVKGVDLADGHLALSRDDLSIAGPGVPLQFSRAYGSAGNRASGPMGAGWSHNYHSRLSVDDLGRVSISGGEGSGIRFTQTSSTSSSVRSFVPQAGYHGRLSYENGAYDYFTKAGVRYHYELAPPTTGDQEYRLTFIEDPAGNRTTLAYEGELLKTVTDVVGRTLVFGYEQKGAVPEPRIVRIDGPLGMVVTYEYDEHANLVKATRGERVEEYAYSVAQVRDRHNLTSVTDPNGRVTTYVYYAPTDTFPGESTDFEWGRDVLQIPQKFELVKKVIEGDGTPEAAETTFAYDYSDRQNKFVAAVTDPRGTVTRYVMNPRGNVNEVRVQLEAGEHVTTMRWAFEEGINDVYLVRRTEPNGRVTRYEYDANGNMTRETIEFGGLGSEYAAVTTAAGDTVTSVARTWEYDSRFNKPVKAVDFEGKETTWTLDLQHGQVLTMTRDPRDGTGVSETSFTYQTVTTAGGATLHGMLVSQRDPRGKQTTYRAFDEWGNATEVVDPEGNVTTRTFDARGRIVESRDTMGRRSTFVYDELDRPITETRFAGNQPADPAMASEDRVTNTTYMPGGEKATVTNGLGHTTIFAYDGLNRLRSQVDEVVNADGQTERLETTIVYDGNGNKVLETDRRGIERRYTWDRLGRLEQVHVNDGSWKLVQAFTYDAAGNRVSSTDTHGHTTTYVLDGLYRTVVERLPLAPYRIVRTFDRMGNELSVTDANGKVARTTYDGLNRVRTRTNALGHLTRYDYDLAGNLVREENVTSGLVLLHGPHDGLNRPTRTVQRFTDPIARTDVEYVTTMTYLDAEHAVETLTPTGAIIRHVYNGHDALVTHVVDQDGLALTTSYAYDGNGNRSKVMDPEGPGPDVVIVYDGLNRAIRKELRLGGVEKTFYDGNGNIVRTVDRRGIVARTEYDALNRPIASFLVESISNEGQELQQTATVYDDAANTVATTDANGATTVREYNALHQEVRFVDALSRVSITEWDGVNKRAEVSRRGLRREMDYDDLNRLVAVREFDAAGSERSRTTTEYLDSLNQRIDTDRRGTAYVTQLDPLQRLRRVSARHADLAASYGAAEIVLEEATWDAAGNRTSRRDANGNLTTMTYDKANRRIQTIEGAGSPVEATTTTTYNGVGLVATVKSGRDTGKPFDWKYTYDERHRKIAQENGEGGVTTFEYDQADNVVAVIEPNGGQHVTRYSFDELGRLLSVDETRGGAGGMTLYQYDAVGNRIAQQDADGNLTTYRYDALDRLTDTYQHLAAGTLSPGAPRTASPGGDEATALHWHYEHDEDGNQSLIVDAEGQRVAMSYDHLNRLVQKDYSAHRTTSSGEVIYPRLARITWTLDANGNAARAEETKELTAGETVTDVTVMAYDRLNRLTSTTNFDGKTVAFGYDREGNRRTVIDADSKTTSYTFDERNRVSTVTSELGDGTGVTRYEYWPDGLLRKTTNPNGTVSEREYDAAGRVTSIVTHDGSAANPIARFVYGYDANGNRLTQVEERRALGGTVETTAYTYDTLNRLVTVAYPGGATVAYTMSLAGNRLTESGIDPATGAALDRTYRYNRVNRLVAVEDGQDPASSVAFVYDRNGNTLERRVGTLSGDTVPSPIEQTAFTFDIRDKLVATTLPSGEVVSFDYNFAGQRTRKRAGALETRYLWDEGAVLQEYDGASGFTTAKYNYGADLLSIVTGSGAGRTSLFYTQDGLGSTADLTNEAGAITASYRFDAWGNPLRPADQSANRRLFTGQYFDTETGLQYFGARYYDARLGRFLTQDPYRGDIGNPPSLHRYSYAHGNPLFFTDPTGYAAEEANPVAVDDSFGTWALGLFSGVVRGIGSGVAGLLESGVKGLADITMAGVGYLAIEATGGKYVDEIGNLLQPVSTIGQMAAEKGTVRAITESATGFVKDTVTGVVTLPERLYDASMSGDPELLGATIVDAVQTLEPLKGPAVSAARKVQHASIALDMLGRDRISKRGVRTLDGRIIDEGFTVTGALARRDAFEIAAACVARGVSGCSVVGGLGEWNVKSFVRNLFADTSLAQADTIRLKSSSGKWVEKNPGDIDFSVHLVDPARRIYTDGAAAQRLNARLTAPMFDAYHGHGIMGEFIPSEMIPDWARTAWYEQQGLPSGSLIRGIDYWRTGIAPAGIPQLAGQTANVAPLVKGGKGGKYVVRAVDPTYFERKNHLQPYEHLDGRLRVPGAWWLVDRYSATQGHSQEK